MNKEMNDVPDYLRSTFELLLNSFPDGIEEDMYLPLLALLYDEMSNRNLAEVISKFTDKDYSDAINDVYRSVTVEKPSDVDLDRVRERLIPHGYKQWLSE